MKLKYVAMLWAALPFAAPVMADNPLASDNVVVFSAEAEQEVAHDALQVAMFIQVENANLQQANNAVNEKINQALDIVKRYEAIEIRDNSRTTHVRYSDSGKQNGWVARAQLMLQSRNTEALEKALGELSGTLAIEYVNSSVSSAALSGVEDELVKQALQKVEGKARMIQTALQAKGYKILELKVITPTGNNDYAPLPYGVMAKANGFSEGSDGGVPLGGGKATVRARVDARIALIKD
ncbi:SIMPL domain-containing protein [Necropsobacter massiliensis]|uniref:SIMPL domain-containing protein n=1 Tax=Necropsobacter massiliensis TaxID=1400001 RepID=UPI000595CF4E|nr:SIMPL domain-containing protein [Necropsobacter massiliensis]